MLLDRLAIAHAITHDEIVPELIEYIAIPNVSKKFDEKWKENGYTDMAVAQFMRYAEKQIGHIPGLTVKLLELSGLTPVIFMEVPATKPEAGTALLYGHLDKQPAMKGWKRGLGPWKPILKGDQLYGRGGADDGYAMFASLAAIRILKLRKEHHGRLVVLIEASEESGSPDLPAYIEAYKDLIGEIDFVVCLDSGCGDYEHLYTTTSLRGIVAGTLKIDVLTEGVHSGAGSGIVPDCDRIANHLIDRFCEGSFGLIRRPELSVERPDARIQEIVRTSDILGDAVYSKFPWAGNTGPESADNTAHLDRGTWYSTVTTIWVGGYPRKKKDAGNVMLPGTERLLSFRIPPTLPADEAAKFIKTELERDPPFGATVTFEVEAKEGGWNGPEIEPWLARSMSESSLEFFGTESIAWGEGGTIPLMGLLHRLFPKAQFMITGILGPKSNAHGPNEFAHIPTIERLIASVAKAIADHANR